MIELPEAYVLAEQINQALVGKTVARATANAHPHAFAWYSGDPAQYDGTLRGRTIASANPGTGYTCGGNTEILCADPDRSAPDMLLVISTPIKYHAPGEKLPKSHQLLLAFEDRSHLSCTVQMWGAMFCYPCDENGLPEEYVCRKTPSPLSPAFDQRYFNTLWEAAKPGLSAKAFLATEQRIPGLGNGVLQDILFRARIHPRQKLQSLDPAAREGLYHSVKTTLGDMAAQGGRDTERDLFGRPGGYRTLLSQKTAKQPCPRCGQAIVREAYLGGNIYFCPGCQPYSKA